MGESLFQTLVEATGLPEEPIERELLGLCEERGANPEDLTLDELRDIMVEYLQTVFLDLQKNGRNVS